MNGRCEWIGCRAEAVIRVYNPTIVSPTALDLCKDHLLDFCETNFMVQVLDILVPNPLAHLPNIMEATEP